MLTSEAVLVHYDSNRPIKLACDASSYGLGAILSHVFEDGEHPVAFVLCTLTITKKNYSQIEKEALALIFGIKNFTNTSLVNMLHRPQAIVINFECKKSCSLCCSSLHAALGHFSITALSIKWHANADSLSRLLIEGEEDQDAAAIAMFKISHIDELPITASDIAEETSKDSVLSCIYKYVMEGWPQRGIEDSSKPFYHS